jgi:hypothetical protein
MAKKYSIFHIEGGLGKHIAATAVAKCIKNNHPDRELIVVCAWPQIYINLPFVDKVYRIGHTAYFYQDYIKDVDSLIFKHEPYYTTNHIHKKKSLIDNWCELYGLEYNEEQPEIVFNTRELETAKGLWSSNKPLMLIHSNGGGFSPDSGLPYRWARDMPFDVVQQLTNHYDRKYQVVQVARPNSKIASGATPVVNEMGVMEYLSLLLYTEKRILIDSSLQHAAKALNKQSTVLWVATSPKVFGYNYHNNIQAIEPQPHKLPDSYLFDYNFEGSQHECPYRDGEQMFDVSEIVKVTGS